MNRFVGNFRPFLNSIVYGYVSGFCVGGLCNHHVVMNYKGTHYCFPKISVPFLTGFICSTAVIFSPFIAIHFMFHGKRIDDFIDRHDINIYRCTQTYPNLIAIDVETKK